MPIYRINMNDGNSGRDAWAAGAKALADAFAPVTYKEQAEAALLGAKMANTQASTGLIGEQTQTEGHRRKLLEAQTGSAWAEKAKIDAERRGLDWEHTIRTKLWEEFQKGDLTREETIQLGAEAGIAFDPAGSLGHLGDVNRVLAANEPGQTQEGMDLPARGAGAPYKETVAGTRYTENMADAAKRRELLNANAEAVKDRALELQKINAAPVDVSENQTVIVGRDHPLYTEENQGIIRGQRSVGVNEQIMGPGGQIEATGPQFVEEAPKAPEKLTYNVGTQEVTKLYMPNHPEADEFGYVEQATAPRAGSTGQVVQTPYDESMTGSAIEQVNDVFKGRAKAQTDIDEARLSMQLLDAAQSGYLTNLTLPLRQFAESIGFDLDTGNIEALNAQLGNFAMSRIQDTKGAVSEKEMAYFIAISPALSKTPEGNRLLMGIREAIAQRQLRAANVVRLSYENDDTPFETLDKLQEFYTENPIVTPEMAQRFGLPMYEPGISPLYQGRGTVPGAQQGTGNPLVDKWAGGGTAE